LQFHYCTIRCCENYSIVRLLEFRGWQKNNLFAD
jgi:hypothetical protein